MLLRSLALLIVGSAAGAAAVHWGVAAAPGTATETAASAGGSGAVGAGAPQAPPGSSNGVATTDDPHGANAETPATSAAGRSSLLDAYAAAAAVSSREELEAMILETASAPRSRARDSRLQALLLRLAEFDVADAARFAWSEHIEARFLVPLYQLWAVEDTDAVLGELARISPATEVQSLALAVLNALGNDAANVARIAAVLPPANRVGFEVEALVARVAADPAQAVRDLDDLETSAVRSFAGARVAAEAVRVDALDAIRQAAMVEDLSSRTSYLGAVFRNWAEIDPEAVFSYLETLRGGVWPAAHPATAALRETGLYSSLVQQIAGSDPQRLLALVEHLPPEMKTAAERAGLLALAATDPLDALARLDTLPIGQERSSLLANVAQAYGRQDPTAAVAWARSLSPPSEDALRGVINGIAVEDPAYAVEIALAQPANPLSDSLIFSAISSAALTGILGGGDRERSVQMLNRLVERDDPRLNAVVSSVASMWTQVDVETALPWIRANAHRLEAGSFMMLGRSIAASQPAAARQMLETLDGPQRSSMIQGIAAGLAERSVDDALAFLEPYSQDPQFSSAFSLAISQGAQRDPEAAARALGRLPPAQAAGATVSVANAWAQRDPVAAARWVEQLADAAAQSTAVGVVGTQWAARDAEAASQWARSLPSGALRDTALAGYLSGAASAGTFDAQALAAIGSESARQDAASRAIMQIGRRDPQRARALLETWITDPQLRRRTEETLMRTAGSASLGGINFILP